MFLGVMLVRVLVLLGFVSILVVLKIMSRDNESKMTSSDIYHEFEMEYGLAARERLLDSTDSRHDKRVLVCRSGRPDNTVFALAAK